MAGSPTRAARLMLPGGYLPTAAARGNARRAPYMQTQGLLASDPGRGLRGR